MPVDPATIAAVFNRVHGYGSNDPTFIFLGMEEACGGEQEVEPRLTLHAAQRETTLLDVVKFHEALDGQVQKTYAEDFFGEDALTCQPTWRHLLHMWAVARSAEEIPSIEEDQRDALRTFLLGLQQVSWGRHGGDHALIELSPIPSRNARQWWGEAIFDAHATLEYPFLATRKATIRRLVSMVRQGTHPIVGWLLRLVANAPPRRRVVIAYGGEYRVHYEQIFAGVTGAGDWYPLQGYLQCPPRWRASGNLLTFTVRHPSQGMSYQESHEVGMICRHWLQNGALPNG